MAKNNKLKGVFGVTDRPLNSEEQKVYSRLLTSLTNAIIGFDPNNNYTVSDSFKPSQMPIIPRDIKTTQESVINLDQKIVDEIINSTKYIYNVEPRIYREDGIHKRKVYVIRLVQKLESGIIPSVVVLSNSESDKNGYKVQKSAFYVCLNGKNYITLDRVDAVAKVKHKNFILGNDGKLLENFNSEKRYIRARLSHRHIYRQNVLIHRTKSIIDNYFINANSVNKKLKDITYYNLDAFIINQIEDFNELIQENLTNLNICPFIFQSAQELFTKNASLSEIFEVCKNLENNIKDNKDEIKYDINSKFSKLDNSLNFIEF